MSLIIFNGQLVQADSIALPSVQRGLFYSDSFFESMKWLQGRICFAEQHWQRMQQAFAILGYDAPVSSWQVLQEQVARLVEQTGPEWDAARVRMQCWRAGEGFYLPQTRQCHYLLTVAHWPEAAYPLNGAGLRLGLYRDQQKSTSTLSNIKSSASLVSVLAAAEAARQQLDEMILYNTHGRPAESTGSNLFLVRQNQLITAPLSEGCLDGVMRRVIMGLAAEEGIPVQERPVTETDLAEAEEVFITNALYGIRWAAQAGHFVYGAPQMAGRLSERLNRVHS